MKIEHLAIWVKDLEQMRNFYENYFQASASDKYHNPKKNFTSYFLSFEDGCRLELMHKPEIKAFLEEEGLGLAHYAVSVGSKEKVDDLTEKIRNDGFQVVGEPRTTGDGYYESVVSDPEGNQVELTV